MAGTPRVFISYSHDSDAHRERVLALAERLRRDGLPTDLDRYVNGTPPEGWPRWMLNRLGEADLVLLICTPTYYRRFRGHEEPGKGKGADWEGAVVTQAIYDTRCRTARYIPVLFDPAHQACIPEPVRGHTFYCLDSEPGYQALYDALLNQGGFEPGPVGEPKPRPRPRAAPLTFGNASSRECEDDPTTASSVPDAPASRLLDDNSGHEIGVQSAQDRRDTAEEAPLTLKITGFGLELGPFEVALPRLWPLLGLALLLAAAAANGLYLVSVRNPMADARTALRMARYDTALVALNAIPTWLDWWPGLGDLRDKARLGNALSIPPQDWEALAIRLGRLRARAPEDADLRVLEAERSLRHRDFAGATETLETAVRTDPANAQAWFLLGLVRDLAGDKGAAVDAYRRALTLAPESPQYQGNLARALLDQGQPAAALAEYRQISRLPLARIEQALAHWALGEFGEAAEAAQAGLGMLNDAKLMEYPPNRLGWQFALQDRSPPDTGVQLASLADKRCYALLIVAASRQLERLGKLPALPPCDPLQPAPPLAIRRLVADDLYRFVDGTKPAPAAAVKTLRHALDQPADCPVPPAADGAQGPRT